MKSPTIHRQGKRQPEWSGKIGQSGDHLKKRMWPTARHHRRPKKGKTYTGADHDPVGKQKAHNERTLPRSQDYMCWHTVNRSETPKKTAKKQKKETLRSLE